MAAGADKGPDTDGPPRPGDVVRLHGVKALSHLNGKEGHVIEFDEASGKWLVLLQSGSRKFKPENLLVIERGEPPDAQPITSVGKPTTPAALPASTARTPASSGLGSVSGSPLLSGVQGASDGAVIGMTASFGGPSSTIHGYSNFPPKPAGFGGAGAPLQGVSSMGTKAVGSNASVGQARPDPGSFGAPARVAPPAFVPETAYDEPEPMASKPRAAKSLPADPRAAKMDSQLLALEELAQKETARMQKLMTTNRAAAMAEAQAQAAAVPDLGELLLQLEKEEDEQEVEDLPAAAAPRTLRPAGSAPPKMDDLLAQLDREERRLRGEDPNMPSLDMVLAGIDEAEAQDASRELFFRLGGKEGEHEDKEPPAPQDALSKMIRATASQLDPRSFLQTGGAAASAEQPGSSAEPPPQPAFQPRKAAWRCKDLEDKLGGGSSSRQAPLRGHLDEAPLFDSRAVGRRFA